MSPVHCLNHLHRHCAGGLPALLIACLCGFSNGCSCTLVNNRYVEYLLRSYALLRGCTVALALISCATAPAAAAAAGVKSVLPSCLADKLTRDAVHIYLQTFTLLE